MDNVSVEQLQELAMEALGLLNWDALTPSDRALIGSTDPWAEVALKDHLYPLAVEFFHDAVSVSMWSSTKGGYRNMSHRYAAIGMALMALASLRSGGDRWRATVYKDITFALELAGVKEVAA